MKTSDSIAKLAPALVAAQSDIKGVTLDATNPHFKNKYASLDGIMATVRPILAKHKLAVLQGTIVPETNEGVLTGFSVETMLVHDSGEWLANAVVIPIDKASAQGAGSAVTYGRRYGISALLALSTDEDDDGETATNHAPQKRESTPAKASAPNNPPAAKPASGDAADFLMPMGKTKGTPLGKLDPDDLRNALKWIGDNKPGKYLDFVAAAEAVLARIDHTGDATDDLPF